MQDPATRIHMLDVGALVGEYRIEKLVGQGGMGQVYGAVHPVIGKRAAIKVLRGELCADPDAIERFVLEARAVNQIGHPNIVDVFAFGALPDGRQYMVMEWLRGESLDARIRRMLPTLEETCEIVLAICAALDAAHAEGIIHRDLKPHNVFMSHARGVKPAVKLLDFGLVKLIGDGHVERTRSGSMLGTPAYMSPEQARGRGVDHRTDLYALGVMLFELVTGTLPFVEQSAMEMVMAHLQTPPPVPSAIRPGLPPVLDRLILGLLEKDPAYRPTLAQVTGVLVEVQQLAAAAPQALTPTVIPSHPVPVATPQAPTLISGRVPAGPAPGLQVASAAASTPIPMLAPSLPAPILATGSVPANPPLAHASTPAVASLVASAPASGGRRALFAIFAMLAVGGIAFGVVMALRSPSEEVASPEVRALTPDAVAATPLAAPDAALAVAVPVAPPDAAPIRVRVRDAGVRAAPPDAAIATPPPAPDAGVVKPIDDGDGLLPSKGGSR